MPSSQLSPQLTTSVSVSANEAEEGLMIDNRCRLKSGDHIDRKLHSLLGDRFSRASSSRSDLRGSRHSK